MSIEKIIPYGRQCIDEDDIEAVVQTLKSDWLTCGPRVDEFENSLNNYIGSKFAVAVNSGTSALDIAIASLELPIGSEVITTPFTFAASANCALYNSCRPIFADINRKTFNIDPEQIKKRITKKTKAIVYVDFAGHPCEIKEISEIAEKFDLYLIEDAAHALGAEYRGKRVGTFADITEFSFHPVKHITTGEGGALTTNNEELAQKLKILRTHGIDRSAKERYGAASYLYDMKYLGRNYRITDIQCALGISQMRKIDKFISRRREISQIYREEFEKMESEIGLQTEEDYAKNAYHLFTILVKKKKRDTVFAELRKRNIGVNVHYIPTYKFTYYKRFKINEKEYPNTEQIFSQIISLPMYYSLTDEELAYVIKTVKDCIK